MHTLHLSAPFGAYIEVNMPASWTVIALAMLGILAGATLALQALINTQLRTFVGSPLRASFVSYVVGTLCCLVLLVFTRQSIGIIEPGFRANWWLWTGGALGLAYIAITIWLLPRLGAAPVFALIVAGQMVASLAFDHFGLFGMLNRPLDGAKLLGVAFLVVGVILVRR